MQLNFLFWNLNKNNLLDAILKLVDFNKINILILVENTIDPIDISAKLTSLNKNFTFAETIGQSNIYIFTTLESKHFLPFYDENRLSLRIIKIPNGKQIHLGVIHFTSKLYFSDSSQLSESFEISKVISQKEYEIDCHNTVLVGDFNMNPFEDGMINANSFNATVDRKIALRGKRVVQGRSYKFFYNPMWNMFGDEKNGPIGTFFYERAEHKTYFWNILDQVIIRPGVIDNFNFESLEIIDTLGETSLLDSNGYPNKIKYSDHLPIKFSINI